MKDSIQKTKKKASHNLICQDQKNSVMETIKFFDYELLP